MDYYDRPDISNSLLGAVKRHAAGETISPAPAAVLEFGRVFHQYILEPEKYNQFANPEIHQKIENMGKAARHNSLLFLLLSNKNVQKETERFWTHERTGLPCKMKADIILFKTIADPKTTSCTSIEEFEASIMQYGYNRQGAWYIDGTGANEFILIGVSKKYPHKTFTCVLKKDDERIIEGRIENELLIDLFTNFCKQGVHFQKMIK